MSENPMTAKSPDRVTMEQKAQLGGFDKFNAAQDLLNCNKILITEINTNHEARTPEGLARNVVLIRELNKNVAEVVKLYKEISVALEESTLKEQSQTQAADPQPQ